MMDLGQPGIDAQIRIRGCLQPVKITQVSHPGVGLQGKVAKRGAHGRRVVFVGQDHTHVVREPADRAALQQQRRQHHHKRHVENESRLGQVGHERKDGQHNRHRAAQSDPGDVEDLPRLEAQRRQAQTHRQRPGHKHQHGGDTQRGPGKAFDLRGRHQQTQQHEHQRLRQPGVAVKRGKGRLHNGWRPPVQHDAQQIHRQKARAADPGGQGEGGQARHGQQQRNDGT